jgi:hypothetical protein
MQGDLLFLQPEKTQEGGGGVIGPYFYQWFRPVFFYVFFLGLFYKFKESSHQAEPDVARARAEQGTVVEATSELPA